MTRIHQLTLLLLPALLGVTRCVAADAAPTPLALDWKDGWLTVKHPQLPNADIAVGYVEAYCRSGSTTNHFWTKTMLKHKTERLPDSDDGRTLNLLSQIEDGVRVTHHITSTADEVLFHVTAENPTSVSSDLHWAQACIRLGHFTGKNETDYLTKCFIFLNGKLTRLPTQPRALEAAITPGQVYCPRHVPRGDVNPRPLSTLVPSNGLVGCFSADEKWIVATAWEPYQELFFGVFACVHSDMRFGGLKPGEKKEARGTIYVTNAGVDQLVARYEHDFPEHRHAP